jgi:dTDP-glucose 4,6-dehydratase
MKALITGGAGFIGHHVVDFLLKNTDWNLTLIDRLDCSGNLNRLAEIGAAKNPRVRFVYHDLRAPLNSQLMGQVGEHDYIVHMAAGTHVDRSIEDPMSFVLDNVVATCNVLDFARHVGTGLFLHFSTDEVFGPAPDGVAFKEYDRYNSGNPYAATKAGSEELAVSYANTYRLPVAITHTMNVIGERQHPEKYVPMTIAKVSAGDVVTVHANKDLTRAGSRFYIYAQDVADGVKRILEGGHVGKWNIVGAQEVDNLQLAQVIAGSVGKPLKHKMTDFHSSRPGHDLRYALDGGRMRDELGWVPRTNFDGAVSQIVDWTLRNPHWLVQ